LRFVNYVNKDSIIIIIIISIIVIIQPLAYENQGSTERKGSDGRRQKL